MKQENLNELEVSSISPGGYFTFEHYRDGVMIDTWDTKNIVTDQGLNYILDAALSGATPATTHYIGLFKNNYTPVAGDTAALFPGGGVASEANTEYNEATRPTWSEAGVSAKVITNSASPAAFTFNTSVTIYGAFLVSTNTKAGTTGVLIAASKFGASRALINGDVLNVTYTLTASSS
jgi:hypothetical protein